MSGLPLVSIVVPVLNGERYLRESLDSILAQTYPATEILVLDDASTDGTPSIIASYGQRLRSVRHPQRRGLFGNVNVGIGLARGEYIAVYHADDVYDARIVEREVSFLEDDPAAGAVFCLDVFIDATGNEYGRLQLPPDLRGRRPLDYPALFNALLTHKNRFLCCPTAMVRAAVYRDVGDYRAAEFGDIADLEMWLRIGRKYSIGIIEQHLMRYRHTAQTSTHRYQYLRTEEERHFAILDAYRADGGEALATREALAAHEAHRAEDRLMRAVSLYILDRREDGRRLLRQVRAGQILGSPRVQRGRLVVLLLLLRVLLRLPRVTLVADLFHRRWHAPGRRARSPRRQIVEAVR
jgi:glycosyltransferase involved in cell wall biosynthesis